MAQRAIQASASALGRLAAKFKALSEPTRLKLLWALQRKERTVSELVHASGTSQGNVSRQLQILSEVGLLHRRKVGLHVYYGIADPSVFQLCRQASTPPQVVPPSLIKPLVKSRVLSRIPSRSLSRKAQCELTD